MGLSQPPAGSDAVTDQLPETGGHGGRIATFMSLLAFTFSGMSFYASALQQADLSVFVPPVMHYARDGADIEVFAIPITIANNGANTGTVLAMELTAETAGPDGKPLSKVYYSAYTGEHQRNPDAVSRSFAPISVPGRGTYSETVRFYPRGNPLPKLVSDKGDVTFTLRIAVASPPEPSWLDRITRPAPPAALTFTRILPWYSEQQLDFRRAAIPMHAKDWQPTASTAR